MATIPSRPSSSSGPSGGGRPATSAAPKRAPAVTPQNGRNQAQLVGLGRQMTVDKNVVDELLLVCGVIGTTTETSQNGVESLVPVTDCLNWLQDLQRALRRDEDLYRPISLLLGKWNVVPKKLLPLVLTCRYDTPMVLTIVKILVILTKPLHENTKRAGKLVIDTKSNKIPEEVIEEQKKLRQNALAQSDMLMEYKKAIVHHPSHRKNKDNSVQGGGVLSIFVSLLAEPLSKTGTRRTDADHLTIELVLHLFRNILSADPIIKGSHEISSQSAQLHNECISLFERELVLDILLMLCQEMELRENAQYNLLMMELMHHLLKGQDPTGVARCMMNNTAFVGGSVAASAVVNKPLAGKENRSKKGSLKKPPTTQNATSGLLRAQLARDRQQFKAGAPARHGNFGGTLMLKRQDGRRQYVSASAVLDQRSQASAASARLAGPKKRKNKRTEPFIGSGRTLLAHTRDGQTQTSHRGPAAIRAQKTLYRFCQDFLKKCYGPLMKSLKNEFRRDSVRLEGEQDKVVFFRIIWFFFQWFRVSGVGKQLTNEKGEGEEGKSALGQLIFTMDVFSFNLVLNATTTFIDKKAYTRLAQTVGLYAEMMHMLHSMYSSEDSTEQMMALGLMDRLFYNSDPVDRLPKLLSSWIPGTTTREYVCDLVECCHMTLKLLDANKKACADIMDSEEAKQATVVSKGKKKKVLTNDAVLQMKLAAADFDVDSYYVRKVVSNHIVFMYTKLLDQYEFNAPHVNHRIVAYFLRLAKVKIVDGEGDLESPGGAGDAMQNLLAPKTTTLEPMLYNMHLIMVLNTILNDPMARNDKSFATLLAWSAGIIHNFANQAQTNPVLFAECLFRHPVPHRFCELSTNMYVNEELRMIAEKDLLLEAHRLERLNADQSDDDEDREQEDEVEFDDEGVQGVPMNSEGKRRNTDSDSSSDEEGSPSSQKKSSKKRRIQPKKKNLTIHDDDSSDEELEFETNGSTTKAADTAESTTNAKPNKLKRKALDDDSSDEELQFEEKPVTAKPSATSKKTQSILEDSSDDDDDDDDDDDSDDEQITKLKKRLEERQKQLKAVLAEESSDDDGDEEPSKPESAGAEESKASSEDEMTKKRLDEQQKPLEEDSSDEQPSKPASAAVDETKEGSDDEMQD